MGYWLANSMNGVGARWPAIWSALTALALLGLAGAAQAETTDALPPEPAYKVDPSWPRTPLPNMWVIGDVGGVSVDRHGHIWMAQRPSTLNPMDTRADGPAPAPKCCVDAPPIIEFDEQGNVLRAWGGPAQYEDWFDSEHSIFVDDDDFVWVLGAGNTDGQLMKFTMDGERLLKIGRKGEFVKADDPTMLGMPTDIYVDTRRKEVFVSDGYRNHRVIVFDSETGAFKRQWTAYGKPVDPEWGSNLGETGSRGPANQIDIFTTVHCVTKIGDEVFVCDRSNSRLQVFTLEGKYLRELFHNKDVAGVAGTTWDAVPVPGHPNLIMVIDGNNNEFSVIDIHTAEIKASYQNAGRYAGQMHWPHQAAMDQQLRLYVAEVSGSRRAQRFIPNIDFGD